MTNTVLSKLKSEGFDAAKAAFDQIEQSADKAQALSAIIKDQGYVLEKAAANGGTDDLKLLKFVFGNAHINEELAESAIDYVVRYDSFKALGENTRLARLKKILDYTGGAHKHVILKKVEGSSLYMPLKVVFKRHFGENLDEFTLQTLKDKGFNAAKEVFEQLTDQEKTQALSAIIEDSDCVLEKARANGGTDDLKLLEFVFGNEHINGELVKKAIGYVVDYSDFEELGENTKLERLNRILSYVKGDYRGIILNKIYSQLTIILEKFKELDGINQGILISLINEVIASDTKKVFSDEFYNAIFSAGILNKLSDIARANLLTKFDNKEFVFGAVMAGNTGITDFFMQHAGSISKSELIVECHNYLKDNVNREERKSTLEFLLKHEVYPVLKKAALVATTCVGLVYAYRNPEMFVSVANTIASTGTYQAAASSVLSTSVYQYALTAASYVAPLWAVHAETIGSLLILGITYQVHKHLDDIKGFAKETKEVASYKAEEAKDYLQSYIKSTSLYKRASNTSKTTRVLAGTALTLFGASYLLYQYPQQISAFANSYAWPKVAGGVTSAISMNTYAVDFMRAAPAVVANYAMSTRVCKSISEYLIYGWHQTEGMRQYMSFKNISISAGVLLGLDFSAKSIVSLSKTTHIPSTELTLYNACRVLPESIKYMKGKVKGISKNTYALGTALTLFGASALAYNYPGQTLGLANSYTWPKVASGIAYAVSKNEYAVNAVLSVPSMIAATTAYQTAGEYLGIASGFAMQNWDKVTTNALYYWEKTEGARQAMTLKNALYGSAVLGAFKFAPLASMLAIGVGGSFFAYGYAEQAMNLANGCLSPKLATYATSAISMNNGAINSVITNLSHFVDFINMHSLEAVSVIAIAVASGVMVKNYVESHARVA